MNRTDATRLALRAAREILEAGRSGEIAIAGTTVKCQVANSEDQSDIQKVGTAQGVENEPWPAAVSIFCNWEGGKAELRLRCAEYRNTVSLFLTLQPQKHELVCLGLGRVLGSAKSDLSIPIRGRMSMIKPRGMGPNQAFEKANTRLQSLVRASGMPLLGRSVEVLRLGIEEGIESPTAEEAFLRIISLGLYKMDFLSRRPTRKAERGTPLIATPALDGLADVDEQGDPEEIEARRYWSGSSSSEDAQESLQRFIAEEVWELAIPSDSMDSQAQTAWKRFREINESDWFAITGLDTKRNLRVHLIGEVQEIDYDLGSLKLSKLASAPNDLAMVVSEATDPWLDTIHELTSVSEITQIFDSEASVEQSTEEPALASNLILYGPPGTGKTWELREKFMPKFRGTAATPAAALDNEQFESLSWFQVVGAALHDIGQPATVPELAEHKWIGAKYSMSTFASPLSTRLWSVLQIHTIEGSTEVKYSRRTGELVFDKDTAGRWSFPAGTPESLKAVALSLREEKSSSDRYRFATFHQSYGYEDFIEGIQPNLADEDGKEGQLLYEIKDGLFMRAVRDAIQLTGYEHGLEAFCTILTPAERQQLLKDAPTYAVFIDEINRGNVARIFGELITLIEPTRRLGTAEELIVTLPTSGRRFGVPSNLHLIGTMNTADRSVEALDTALRRRFAFRECPPKPELLDVMVDGGIDPAKLLECINARLLKLLDRDHLLGHAYLLPLKADNSFEKLQSIFRDSILPLLQEYFYGDWGRIGLVLGKAFVRRHNHTDVTFADFPHDDREALAERSTFELVDVEDLSSEAFKAIYEDVPGHN